MKLEAWIRMGGGRGRTREKWMKAVRQVNNSIKGNGQRGKRFLDLGPYGEEAW